MRRIFFMQSHRIVIFGVLVFRHISYSFRKGVRFYIYFVYFRSLSRLVRLYLMLITSMCSPACSLEEYNDYKGGSKQAFILWIFHYFSFNLINKWYNAEMDISILQWSIYLDTEVALSVWNLVRKFVYISSWGLGKWMKPINFQTIIRAVHTLVSTVLIKRVAVQNLTHGHNNGA